MLGCWLQNLARTQWFLVLSITLRKDDPIQWLQGCVTLQQAETFSHYEEAVLQEFLMQCQHTPLDSGCSPSELLSGWQIWSKLDALQPLPAHVAQAKQARKAARDQQMEHSHLVTKMVHLYAVSAPCYTLYSRPKHNNGMYQQWLNKVLGTRGVNVWTGPTCTWRQNIDQLCPHYGVEEDTDPEELPMSPTKCPTPEEDGNAIENDIRDHQTKLPLRRR